MSEEIEIEQYTPTTKQVEDALAFAYGYGLGGLPECPENVVPEDAVRRWLAKRDAEIAAKAYERGRLDERHDCNRFQEYRDGLMTEAQLKNNLRSRNPYQKAVQS